MGRALLFSLLLSHLFLRLQFHTENFCLSSSHSQGVHSPTFQSTLSSRYNSEVNAILFLGVNLVNAFFFISSQSMILRIKLDNDYKVLSTLYVLSKLLRQSVPCPLSMWEEYSMVARMALLGVLVRSELVMSFNFLWFHCYMKFMWYFVTQGWFLPNDKEGISSFRLKVNRASCP